MREDCPVRSLRDTAVIPRTTSFDSQKTALTPSLPELLCDSLKSATPGELCLCASLNLEPTEWPWFAQGNLLLDNSDVHHWSVWPWRWQYAWETGTELRLPARPVADQDYNNWPGQAASTRTPEGTARWERKIVERLLSKWRTLPELDWLLIDLILKNCRCKRNKQQLVEMVFLLSGCCIFSRWSWMQLSGMEEILRDSGEIVRWTEAGLRIDLVQFHIAIFSASSFLVCCAFKTAETDSREKILAFSIYERNTQDARLTPEIYVCGCVRPHLVSFTEFTSNFTFLVCQNTCHVKAEAQGTVREPESTGAKTPWLITWRWRHKLRDTSQNT